LEQLVGDIGTGCERLKACRALFDVDPNGINFGLFCGLLLNNEC